MSLYIVLVDEMESTLICNMFSKGEEERKERKH